VDDVYIVFLQVDNSSKKREFFQLKFRLKNK